MSDYISQRAAECQRLMEAETDEIQKMSFRLLHEMWLALADAVASMTKEELDREIANLDQIQVNLDAGRLH